MAPKIAYNTINFTSSTQEVIDQANEIIEEYQADGFDLTLRQLYYQFVSRDLLPNKMKSYNRLGNIVNKARMCGEIDWNAIEDRTRSRRGLRHYDDPKDLIESSYWQYQIDMWENQGKYIEVWIEKDALTGVIRRVCNKNDISYFSCRGYVSQSEMWRAGQRLGKKYFEDEKQPIILHLGDHDPSGIDMTRDIKERLNLFAVHPDEEDWAERWHPGFEVEVKRIALNMPQIDELEPPPNPAKVTDSRFDSYLSRYGHESWELDALEPRYIEDLIEQNIKELRDEEAWQESKDRLEKDEKNLEKIYRNYGKIVEFLNGDNHEN